MIQDILEFGGGAAIAAMLYNVVVVQMTTPPQNWSAVLREPQSLKGRNAQINARKTKVVANTERSLMPAGTGAIDRNLVHSLIGL